MKSFCLTIGIALQFNIMLAQIPVDSLVGHWKFDGNTLDDSHYQNNGTMINAATFTYDRFNIANKAIKLVNSLQQYVDVPNSSSLQIDSAITISFWAKRTTYGGGIIDQVLNKGGDWPLGTCNYGLVFSDNTLIFLHNNGYHGIAVPGIPSNLLLPYSGPYGSTLPGVPQDTLWHHYVVTTFDNSPIAYFYVDSLWVPSFWDGWGQNVVLNPSSTANLHIGGVNYYSNNILDDVRIYRKTVSQSEVAALFTETCNTTSSISVTACNSYIAPDGNIYTSSGIIAATITNISGCDSIITINLTINTVDNSVIQNGAILTANAIGASYQWLDCDNYYSEISNETNQSFTPIQNGNYAVQIIQNSCTDTSACYLVTTVGSFEKDFTSKIKVYPNPTKGELTIMSDYEFANAQVVIRNLMGQEKFRSNYISVNQIDLNFEASAGVYFIEITDIDKTVILKLVKD